MVARRRPQAPARAAVLIVPREYRRFHPPPGCTPERLVAEWDAYHAARDAWFREHGLMTNAERSLAIGRSIRADRGEA